MTNTSQHTGSTLYSRWKTQYSIPALVLATAFLLASCGALEPKYYPENQTIMSTFFPTENEAEVDPVFEQKVENLLVGKDITGTKTVMRTPQKPSNPNKVRVPKQGSLLIINALPSIDSNNLKPIMDHLRTNSSFEDVQMAGVSELPSLRRVRLMAARQRADFVLLINAFTNEYNYFNSWTLGVFATAGFGIFYFPNETVQTFVKVEYSLLDVHNNIIVANDSAMGDAMTRSTLPESGVAQYRMKKQATLLAVNRLTPLVEEKF